MCFPQSVGSQEQNGRVQMDMERQEIGLYQGILRNKRRTVFETTDNLEKSGVLMTKHKESGR